MGDVPDAAALLAGGALRTTVDHGAVGPALSSGQPGVARYTDSDGEEVIAGYDLA